MLLKVYESAPLLYLPVGQELTPYIDKPELLEPPREYCEAMWWGDFDSMSGVKTIWTDSRNTLTGYERVYGIFCLYSAWHNFAGAELGVEACWDAATGDLLWVDRETWTSYALDWALWRLYMFQDDQGYAWSAYRLETTQGADVVRHPFLTERISQGPAGQAGEISYMTYDRAIIGTEWLTEDGSEPAVDFGIGLYIMGLHWGSDRAFAYQSVTSYLNGQPPPYRFCLTVFSISTRRRLGYIPLRDEPYKILCVDSNTIYCINVKGDVEVIDVNLRENTGTLSFEMLSGSYLVQTGNPYNKLEYCYDKHYRRLMTFRVVPDDETTGECYSRLEAFKMLQVGTRLTPPLPLQVPRDGKTVKTVSQLYGDLGAGIPGAPVTFSGVGDGTGELTPATVATDSIGYARTLWQCGDSGSNNVTLTATTDMEQVLPGVGGGVQYSTSILPPSIVESLSAEAALIPGYWLSVRATEKYPSWAAESVLGPYLDDFDAGVGETSPFVGAMLEYTWAELHPDVSTYDLSRMASDIAYLASKGLKAIVSIKSTPYVGATRETWVPDWIVNNEYEVFPLSGNALDAGGVPLNLRGVFSSTDNYSPYEEYNVLVPMLFDDNVRSAFVGLVSAILSTFAGYSTLVGMAPLELPKLSSQGVYNAVSLHPGQYTEDDFSEARRTIFSSFSGNGSVLFYEWSCNTNYLTSSLLGHMGYISTSHRDWCVSNYVNFITPYFTANGSAPLGHVKGALTYVLPNIDKTAVTGIHVPSWAWGSPYNMECTSSLATPLEMLLGGPDLSAADCAYSVYDMMYTEKYSPWLTIVEVAADKWGGGDGIKAAVLERLPRKQTAYFQ